MLATLISAGSVSASTQTERGASARSIRRATISCSRRFLALCRSCSPRWSSTAGSALRRVEPASATVATPAPRRRTSSSGLAPRKAACGRPDAEAEARREDLPQGVEHRRRIVGRRRFDRDLAGEHDLLELAGVGSARVAGGDRLLVATRRRDARDPGRTLRRRVESSAAARSTQRREPALEPLAGGSRIGARLEHRVERQPGLPPRAQQRELGQHQQRGRERRPMRAREPPSSAKANPPVHTGPAPAGSPSGSTARRSRVIRRARRRPGRRSDAARARPTSWADPSAASAKPSRSGCSQQNQRSSAQPRGEHGGARIGDLDIDRDADQAAAPPAARTSERRPSDSTAPAASSISPG